MKITLITVGSVKEKFLRDAAAEYAKRLSSYCTLQIIEVADEKTKENMSEAQTCRLLKMEGDRILKHIPEQAHVAALAIEGKQRDSLEMARWLDQHQIYGTEQLVFVIGGSCGLSDEVLKRADEQISFSKLTFPHQLMRVIFLEQLYRWFKIIRHEPYHK